MIAMLNPVRLVVLLFSFMLAFIVITPSDVVAQSTIRFRDTPGALAFSAKDYPLALEEFLKLRKVNPNNSLILRYLAITLSQLGRYAEAINVFKEALAITPNKPWLHYHLGVTYYDARLGEQAAASFAQVIKLAPGTQYAELASRYLDAIGQQQAQQQRTGAPKRFGAFVQGSYQHDNNVLSAADGAAGRRSSNRYAGYVNLDYYLHRSPVWLATVSINGYQSRYTDDSFDALEIPQYSSGLRLQRTGILGKYPYIGSANYNYRRVELADGSPYSRSHALTLGLRMNLSTDTATYGYYRYTDDDFAEEGFDPLLSSRDADNHAVGLRHTWFFAKRLGQLSASLDYAKNNADGTNFEMNSLSGTVSAIFPLPWSLRAEFDAVYGSDDYNKFAGPVRRQTDRTTATAGLSRWFGQGFQLRLNYSYREEDSSYQQLSYGRETWGASVNYVY